MKVPLHSLIPTPPELIPEDHNISDNSWGKPQLRLGICKYLFVLLYVEITFLFLFSLHTQSQGTPEVN